MQSIPRMTWLVLRAFPRTYIQDLTYASPHPGECILHVQTGAGYTSRRIKSMGWGGWCWRKYLRLLQVDLTTSPHFNTTALFCTRTSLQWPPLTPGSWGPYATDPPWGSDLQTWVWVNRQLEVSKDNVHYYYVWEAINSSWFLKQLRF